MRPSHPSHIWCQVPSITKQVNGASEVDITDGVETKHHIGLGHSKYIDVRCNIDECSRVCASLRAEQCQGNEKAPRTFCLQIKRPILETDPSGKGKGMKWNGSTATPSDWLNWSRIQSALPVGSFSYGLFSSKSSGYRSGAWRHRSTIDTQYIALARFLGSYQRLIITHNSFFPVWISGTLH